MKRLDVKKQFMNLALKYNTTETFEGTQFHDDICRVLINLKILPTDYLKQFDAPLNSKRVKVEVKQYGFDRQRMAEKTQARTHQPKRIKHLKN